MAKPIEKQELTEVSEAQIAVHWKEEEYYQPSERFKAQANVRDPRIFEQFTAVVEHFHLPLIQPEWVLFEVGRSGCIHDDGAGTGSDRIASLPVCPGIDYRVWVKGVGSECEHSHQAPAHGERRICR